jgi:hypothetical protein
MNLGNEGRFVAVKEALDAWQGRNEPMGKIRKGRFSDNDEQTDLVSHYGVTFIGFVTNASIVGQRDPAALAHLRQPNLVGRIRRKVISVPLDGLPGSPENFSELSSEAAVSEENQRQAARS